MKKIIPLLTLIILVSLFASAFFFYQSSKLQNQLSQIQTTVPVASPTPTPDPTANWKTYTDTKNRFTFRYPTNLALSNSPDYDYVHYLETNNYKPLAPGSYKIQIEVTTNGKGIPKVIPPIDTNTPEGTFTDKQDFVSFNQAVGIVTTYKGGWINYKRYDLFSNNWKVDFFGTGVDHSMLDQILSTFNFLPTVSCKPRPACLDATPPCKMPETPDMCPTP